jgi:hypothetical protein
LVQGVHIPSRCVECRGRPRVLSIQKQFFSEQLDGASLAREELVVYDGASCQVIGTREDGVRRNEEGSWLQLGHQQLGGLSLWRQRGYDVVESSRETLQVFSAFF